MDADAAAGAESRFRSWGDNRLAAADQREVRVGQWGEAMIRRMISSRMDDMPVGVNGAIDLCKSSER